MIKTLILSISLFVIFILQSCTCNQKYNHLQHQYTAINAKNQVKQDSLRWELDKKEIQIQELLKHIKELETNIKKLEAE